MNFGKDVDEKLAVLGYKKTTETLNQLKIIGNGINSAVGVVTYERKEALGEIHVVSLVKNLSGRCDLRSYEKSSMKAYGLSYTELELFMKKMKQIGFTK